MVIFTARQNLVNLNEVKINLIVKFANWPGNPNKNLSKSVTFRWLQNFTLYLLHVTLYIYIYRVVQKECNDLIVNFINVVDETELFCISFGRTFIYQQNDTMIISFG